MNPEFLYWTDYADSATDPHIVIMGHKGSLGRKSSWHPKICGFDPEDGTRVTIAFYELEWETTAEARKLASAMLKAARQRRKGG